MAMPAFAQEPQSANDIVKKMKTLKFMQQDQVTNITPIIENIRVAFHDLQKSIDDGTINPSAIDSQKQANKS